MATVLKNYNVMISISIKLYIPRTLETSLERIDPVFVILTQPPRARTRKR